MVSNLFAFYRVLHHLISISISIRLAFHTVIIFILTPQSPEEGEIFLQGEEADLVPRCYLFLSKSRRGCGDYAAEITIFQSPAMTLEY